MESWRKVWREGLVPLLSRKTLEQLRRALVEDDQRLIQGVSTIPLSFFATPVEACCLIGFCGWCEIAGGYPPREGGRVTAEEVAHYFAEKCHEIDRRLGEPAACRWLLNWFDEVPRDIARQQLILEVEQNLRAR